MDRWKRLLMSQLSASDRLESAAYVQLLKQCGERKALPEGRRVHAHIARSGGGIDTVLANFLVQMYGKCGSVAEARQTFDAIARPNTFSWNFLIAAYTSNRCGELAKWAFDRTPERNVVTWNALLAAMVASDDCEAAGAVFEKLPRRNCASWSLLTQVYARKGEFDRVKAAFDATPERDIVSWTVLVQANTASSQRLDAARTAFERMPMHDVVSCISIMQAYVKAKRFRDAREVFDGSPEKSVKNVTLMIAVFAQNGEMEEAVSLFKELPAKDVFCWNTLVQGFVETGDIVRARMYFDAIPEKNTVSWNVMILGHAQRGEMMLAKDLFDSTDCRCSMSWTPFITAYAEQGDLDKAVLMFQRMPQHDTVSATAMVTAYARAGNLAEANKLFEAMPHPNVVTWNSLMAASPTARVLAIFRRMDLEGFLVDSASLVVAVDSCAELTLLRQGRILHSLAAEAGLLTDSHLLNALLHMYNKCGSLDEARRVFDSMSSRNITSWTSMIAAYAQNGHPAAALELVPFMEQDGAKPDGMTLQSVLHACSHAGLLEDALRHLCSMRDDHGINVDSEHYGCLVDLLGRAGKLQEAERLIREMPFEPGDVPWTSLMGACKNHGDGRRVQELMGNVADGESCATYVLVSNMISETV